MFKDVRRFIRWADAVLDADRTRDKCEAVYESVEQRCKAEEQEQVKVEEASKDSSRFFRELLVTSVPTIMKILSDNFDKPKTEIHVGRPPVVVDRGEQGDPERSQAPVGAVLTPEAASMIESLLHSIPKVLQLFEKRLSVLESTSATVAADLSKRLKQVETALNIQPPVPSVPPTTAS